MLVGKYISQRTMHGARWGVCQVWLIFWAVLVIYTKWMIFCRWPFHAAKKKYHFRIQQVDGLEEFVGRPLASAFDSFLAEKNLYKRWI